MPKTVGTMAWEEMNWLFPDFEETGLFYHGTRFQHLPTIFREGLHAGPARDGHETIYRSLVRHRPVSIPDWVDPAVCVFAYMNKAIYPSKKHGAVIGIRATAAVRSRTWLGVSKLTDWLYCLREAGYFDCPSRSAYYTQVIEPACADTYWKLSLSFEDNSEIRHDQLLPLQGETELLICLLPVPPELLSLAALEVPGRTPILRSMHSALFEDIEAKFRSGLDAESELHAIEEQAKL